MRIQYMRGSHYNGGYTNSSVIHAPKGFAVFGGGIILILIAAIAGAYISTYLFPLLVLLKSFYMPIVLGVGISSAVIGALALGLSGSLILSAMVLILALFAVMLMGLASGFRETI